MVNGYPVDYSARIQLYVYLAFFLPTVDGECNHVEPDQPVGGRQQRTEYEERSRMLGEKISEPLQEFELDPVNFRRDNQIRNWPSLPPGCIVYEQTAS